MEIYIVDENDNEIGTKEIHTVDWKNDIYRAAAIWLYNDQGEVLSAQRALTKEQSPGTWGPSAAGIIEVGETYDSNILKEVQEEIGVTLSADEVTQGPKILMERNDPPRQYFMQLFFAKFTGSIEDLTIQEEEVAAVKWISKEELFAAAQKNIEHFSDIKPEVIQALKDHETRLT